MTINYLELEPTDLDLVLDALDPSHCDVCHRWSNGLQPWWSDPDTVEGQAQIAEIVAHYERN